MTKFTLLAAASVAALVSAGAAQAGTITSAQINAVAIDPANATPANRTFYTIAKERADAVDTGGTGSLIVANTLTTAPSIAVGAQAQNYSVTFDIVGGTIPTAVAAGLTVQQTAVGGATVGGTSVVQGARSATSITFIVTVNAPTVAGSSSITGFTLTTDVANSAAEANITIGSTTQLLAGGVASTIDTTAQTTLVRYVNAVGAFTAVSKNAKAALPDFKLFSVTGLADPAALSDTNRTAELATYSIPAASTTNNVGATFYGGLTGAVIGANAAAVRDAIVNGATVTVTGGSQLNVLTPSLTGIAPATAPALTAASATFTLTNAEADVFSAGSGFKLTQTATAANQVPIAATTFTTSYQAVYAGGFTAPAAATSVSPTGVITLDGVNFIAPWIGGSQAPGQTVIRLSNAGAAASGLITLRLFNAQARAAGVTTGPGAAIPAATCSAINGTPLTIPAGGELQLTGASFTSCFGAFLRGDVQITIQSASDALTAKARNVDAAGNVQFEQTLGRFSGSAAAAAAF